MLYLIHPAVRDSATNNLLQRLQTKNLQIFCQRSQPLLVTAFRTGKEHFWQPTSP